jgi:hypothetical protein
MISERDVYVFLKQVYEDKSLSAMVNPRDDELPSLCYYSRDGKNCLIGYWFVDQLGADDEFLQLVEGHCAANAIDSAMEHGIIDEIDPLAVETLTLVQEYADHYEEDVEPLTWGRAIAKLFGH